MHSQAESNESPPPSHSLSAPRDPTTPTLLPSLLAALALKCTHSPQATNPHPPPIVHLTPRDPAAPSPCPPYSQPQPSSALTSCKQRIFTPLPQFSRPRETPQRPLPLPSLLAAPALKCTQRPQRSNCHHPPTVLSAPRDPTVPTRPALPTRSPSLQVHSQAANNKFPPPSQSPLGPERPHSALSPCPPYSQPQPSSALTRRKQRISTPPPTVLSAPRDPIVPSPLVLSTRSPNPQMHSHAPSNKSPPPSHSPLGPGRPHSALSSCPPYSLPQRSSALTDRKQRIPNPLPQSSGPRETTQHPLSLPSLLAAPALKCTHTPQATNPHPPPTVLSAPRDPTAPTLFALPTRSPSPQVHSQAASNESPPPSHSPLGPKRPHSALSPCPPYSQPQPSSALTGLKQRIPTPLSQSSQPRETPQRPLPLPSLLAAPALNCTHKPQAMNLHPPPTVLSAPRDPTATSPLALPTRSPSPQVHSQATSNESPPPSHTPFGPERPHSAFSPCPPYSQFQPSSALTGRKQQIPTPLPQSSRPRETP